MDGIKIFFASSTSTRTRELSVSEAEPGSDTDVSTRANFSATQIIMPSTLGYWSIRGRAQPIRLLLKYVGEEFEDVQYKFGEGPEFSTEEWLRVKYTLGLDFPNLPYYIDGDLKLTQSFAIFRHLARKYNLYGDTETEKSYVDLLVDESLDLRIDFEDLCYESDFSEKEKTKFAEKIKPKLEQLEKFLANKQFFIGDKVTACDFHIYEVLDTFKVYEPKLLENRPKLTEYLDRFEKLPAIKAYINSGAFISRPINAEMAHFF